MKNLSELTPQAVSILKTIVEDEDHFIRLTSVREHNATIGELIQSGFIIESVLYDNSGFKLTTYGYRELGINRGEFTQLSFERGSTTDDDDDFCAKRRAPSHRGYK